MSSEFQSGSRRTLLLSRHWRTLHLFALLLVSLVIFSKKQKKKKSGIAHWPTLMFKMLDLPTKSQIRRSQSGQFLLWPGTCSPHVSQTWDTYAENITPFKMYWQRQCAWIPTPNKNTTSSEEQLDNGWNRNYSCMSERKKKCRWTLQEVRKDEEFGYFEPCVWSEREYSVSPLLEKRGQIVLSPCCDAGWCDEPYKHSKDKMCTCVCAHVCACMCCPLSVMNIYSTVQISQYIAKDKCLYRRMYNKWNTCAICARPLSVYTYKKKCVCVSFTLKLVLNYQTPTLKGRHMDSELF